VCHGLLREVAHARQSVSIELSYCKLRSDAAHIRVQSEQKFIEYNVIIFNKINMPQVSRKKKLWASPLEFNNIYNKHDILHFMTK
jgi:hypothetical protein